MFLCMSYIEASTSQKPNNGCKASFPEVDASFKNMACDKSALCAKQDGN